MCLRQMECDAESIGLLRARNLFFFLLSIEPSFIFVGRVHFHFASSSIERASAAREEIDRRSWPLARSHHNQTPAEATEREKRILSLSLFQRLKQCVFTPKGFQHTSQAASALETQALDSDTAPIQFGNKSIFVTSLLYTLSEL